MLIIIITRTKLNFKKSLIIQFNSRRSSLLKYLKFSAQTALARWTKSKRKRGKTLTRDTKA